MIAVLSERFVTGFAKAAGFWIFVLVTDTFEISVGHCHLNSQFPYFTEKAIDFVQGSNREELFAL